MSSWRVGHRGRDAMYYEEQVNGSWERIEIQGEMLMGVAHHVIYFDPPSRWSQHPVWARHRRDEIIARIKSEFHAPDYEYAENVSGSEPSAAIPARTSSPSDASSTARATAGPAVFSPPPNAMRALRMAIAFLLILAGGMSWLVVRGITRGETFFPTKRATPRRMIERAQEPAMFWVSTGIYAVIGVGALGLGVWGIRERQKIQPGRE